MPSQLLLLLRLLPAAAVAAAMSGRGATSSYCRNYGGCYPHAYPQPDHPYLPAPPGKTPRCAKPGATFCETADHYPAHLVQYLIDRWAFDYNTLLKSEAPDNFNFKYPPTYGPYGPPFNNAVQAGADNGTHGVLPFEPHQEYGPPGYQKSDGGYPDRRYKLDASQTSFTYPPPPSEPAAVAAAVAAAAVAERQSRLRQQLQQQQQQQQQQPVSINPSGPAAWARFRRGAPKHQQREKRQSSKSSEGTTLCPTSPSFVAPQAALNTKGNWMFVANVPDRQRYTQLVRTETCISSECDGICSLPNGYTSRCEQQYVQKRLVALGGSGDRLYTDTFWFPHCCVCQISAQPTPP